MKLKTVNLGFVLIPLIALACLSAVNCRVSGRSPQTLPYPVVPASRAVGRHRSWPCHNEALTFYDELLLIVPHPDDEVLGFAGLMSEFIRLGKPVSIVIVTAGDSYCQACAFWKNIGDTRVMSEWSPCTEADLAQFAAIRREESVSAQKILGGPSPAFWNYPDSKIWAAWDAICSHKGANVPLHRSDCSLAGVFEKGSAIASTPRALYSRLSAVIAKSSSRVLIGTTHPLDGNEDHRGLGRMIRSINAYFAADGDPATAPRSVAFAVIHTNTFHNGHYPDWWYPFPNAVASQCFDQGSLDSYAADKTLLERMREFRYHPEWPWRFPDNNSYVASIPNSTEVSFCLPPSMVQGEAALKLLAVRAFASQQGFLARSGKIPPGLEGLVDCLGYQLAFVRANELFVLEARE
jgi:LmbE family N-acetylglucosaminyl deacetylase